jgi:hypothetical protein
LHHCKTFLRLHNFARQDYARLQDPAQQQSLITLPDFFKTAILCNATRLQNFAQIQEFAKLQDFARLHGIARLEILQDCCKITEFYKMQDC